MELDPRWAEVKEYPIVKTARERYVRCCDVATRAETDKIIAWNLVVLLTAQALRRKDARGHP
jgi:hypothetical protein